MYKITSKKYLNPTVTMMDIEAPTTAEIVEALERIDGVFRARIVK